MPDDKKSEHDDPETDAFFDRRREDIEREFAEASSGFDWTDERTIWDSIRDAVPEGLPREIPPDVQEHFKIAQRHLLIGFKSLLDAWIARLDEPARAPKPKAVIKAHGPTGPTRPIL